MKREMLLVDDDPLYRGSIISLLGDKEYRFREADSPDQAIAVLQAEPQIRVILLDLSFAGGDATPILDFINTRSRDYRVIISTGHDELLLAESAAKYSVFHYLPKGHSSGESIRFSIDQAFKDLERDFLNRKVRLVLDAQRKVNANADTEETLDQICESLRLTVGAYTCHVRVYDFRRGDYHLKGFAGCDTKQRQVFLRPKAKGVLFSGRVAETQAPEVFSDIQSGDAFHLLTAEMLTGEVASPEERIYWKTIRSTYAVPISTGLFGNSVDAVLCVSSARTDFFDEERQAAVGEFVPLAALTIAREWQQRNREELHRDYSQISRMLNDVSAGLTGSASLSGIYGVVIQRIAELLNPELVSIFLYDDARGCLENVAELRRSHVERPSEVYLPGQSLTDFVFRSGRPVHLPTPGEGSRVLRDDSPYLETGFDEERNLLNIPSGTLRHYLGVPIRIGGKVRGVLRAINHKSIYYNEASQSMGRLSLLDRGFSADSRNVMEITASHLAVAIHNAELLQEKNVQVEQIRTLGEVGRLINSALNIDEVLAIAIQKMAEVIQAEICTLFLKDGGGRLLLKQCIGMPMIPGAYYDIGEGVTGRVAGTGVPWMARTIDRHAEKYDSVIQAFLSMKHGEPRSIDCLMVVPIIAKDKILGAMEVINRVGTSRSYSESDLDLFQTLAAYVAVAIENAQIYKLTNERLAIAERNAALSTLVTAVAHEINNTSGLIPANVEAIKEELGTSHPSITDMLTTIGDAATQAAEFANELAGFSANRLGEKRLLDVNEVIRAAIDVLTSGQPRYKAIVLRLSPSDQPLVCEIYRTPFSQILRNVVLNAFQALEGRHDGLILVSASRGRGDLARWAVIEIQDNGPGIKREHLTKIFKPAFTTKPKGIGVGLWLVRTQLESFGGEIEVESAPGRGAKFIIRIPLAEAK